MLLIVFVTHAIVYLNNLVESRSTCFKVYLNKAELHYSQSEIKFQNSRVVVEGMQLCWN